MTRKRPADASVGRKSNSSSQLNRLDHVCATALDNYHYAGADVTMNTTIDENPLTDLANIDAAAAALRKAMCEYLSTVTARTIIDGKPPETATVLELWEAVQEQQGIFLFQHEDRT